MTVTSASLLERVKLDRVKSEAQSPAWQRLVEIYEPLIRGWLRRHNLADSDADDLVQEVMTIVVRRLLSAAGNRSWRRTASSRGRRPRTANTSNGFCMPT
jgi:DNA-directed RNA polymerase specialized sigma24 family protein